MKISPARAAAFRILKKIELDGGLSAALLPETESSLVGADRGLCHALVLGTLRRQILLDRYIDALTGGRKLDREVRIILRLGVFQLKFLERVPPHAAINESVHLTRAAKKASASGFVNAILREFVRDEPTLEFADEIDRLVVETSHPASLLARWSSQFGAERAAAIANANNEPPRLAFRRTPRTEEVSISSLINSGVIRHSEFVSGGFVAENLTDELRELDADGRIYFQDEASQLVGVIAAKFVRHRILDVCAAPGSKGSLIASLSADREVIAGDLPAKRIEILTRLLRKQQASNVRIVRYDAERPLPFAPVFDTILVDAPCSGTGTIRHNPEIRYRVKADELERFQARQLRMLRNAADCLRPAGNLAYSTCSLEREENEDVIAGFLAERSEFEVVKIDGCERFTNADGTVRTYPDRDGIDGFFVAVLRRKT
ncbi:MAG: 16S rRNA (cytosine(967)-C(5))-methyltransferase RsmB [Acidobacteria bacterium]|nr:16S rRNA (cytosine(967)-C(5))-methyltransferase RsmB [Acidobacteriota bacterium]